MRDLWALEDPYYGGMNIVALDANGTPAAAANVEASYIYITDEMNSYAEAPRTVIARPASSTSA